ncbi:MAG: thiamine pyrophosphate-binding protein [Acidimicrobiales bacterium]|jgi:acetolactate synthase-1/2/3 large subunit|nr:thiamine pyrophosphate-binding protein [Acidimicrobiales bacterium]
MARIDGGEVLVRALQAEGIEVVFSISDIASSPMLRSAEAAGLRHVGPRHESAAVHMADAWARCTGAPAVVVGAAGPGVANMVPGLMCAWMEGVPVLAIGTQRVRRSTHAVRRGRFQFGPQVEVVRPVTKFAATVEEARRLPEFVREATRQALSGRQGPVFLEIPTDVLLEVVDEDEVVIGEPEWHRFGPGAPDAAALLAAAELLASAEFPVVLAGHGVHRGDAAAELRAVAEHLGALVMTTPGARGAFPEDHPQSVGMTFPWGTPAHLDSDVILAVGTQLGEPVQYLSPPAWAGPPGQRLVHLDADPTQIGVNRATDVALVGDAKAGLAALAETLRTLSSPRSPSAAAAGYASEYRDFKRLLLDSYAELDGSPVHPGRLAVDVARHLPEDAVLCVDGGDTGLWAHLATVHRRPRSLLWTGHYGHLGTGLPYAIGAKLACPDRPVVLFSGDGAFGFNLQELETASREGVAVVVIINCDHAWGMEAVHMRKVAGTTIGVKLSEARYDLVAQALGCHGELVERAEDVVPALERSLAAGRPAVVQVLVDADENENPPGLDDFAAMYSAANT